MTPNVNIREYRDWRNKGVAFEIRMATYVKANRTMSSYIDGNRSSLLADKEKGGQSCLVRGFWGDIVISPYPTLSLEVDLYPENERLFKKRNEMHMHVEEGVNQAGTACR